MSPVSIPALTRTLLLLVALLSLVLPPAALASPVFAPDDPAALSYAWSATIGAEPQPGFAQPTGIDVGPDGNIYISDATRNDVQVFTPAGVFLRKLGSVGSGSGQFRELADIAARGGKLYVADKYNARVQVLSAEGALQATVDGRQPVPNAAQVRLPWRVDADASGRIFLFNLQDEKLFRYSPSGSLERRYEEPCIVGTEQGLAVLSSGVAFCSAIMGGVWRLPITGAGTNIGGIGQTTGLGAVTDLSATPDDTIWAYRNSTNSSAGGPKSELIHLAADGAILARYNVSADILDIAASADRIFALTTARRVRLYDWGGRIMGEWGADAFAGPTTFEKPDRVVAAPDGTFYVLERARKRLRHMSASGELLAQLAPAERQGNLAQPVDMAVDGLNRVYVLDQAYMPRIMRYAHDRFDTIIPLPSSSPYMYEPQTIAITGDTVLVSQGKHILRFDLTGRRLGQTEAPVSEYASYVESALAGPNRLFRLYTGSASADAVIGYDLLGKQFVSWGKNRSTGDTPVGPGVFVYPSDVAADLRGRIVVVDTEQPPLMPGGPAYSSRVQIFDENGGFLTAFGGYGSQPGQFVQPQSVAALADGRLIVADTGNNRLQVFSPTGALPALNPLPAPQQWPGGGPLRAADWQNWGTRGMDGFREILIPPQPSTAQPIFAVYGGGLAISTDGAQWSRVATGKLPSGPYQYAGAGTLIANGGWTDAPYRSADLGRTWTRMSDKVPTGPTFIAPSPNFDADRTLFLAAFEGGVWRSTDAGDTWELRGGVNQKYYDLVALPAQGGGRALLAMAGNNPAGIHRSTDDGATWQLVDGEAGNELTVSPTVAQDQTIFATGEYYQWNGLKRSTDGGLTWQQVGAETTQHWRNVALSPTYSADRSIIVWASRQSYISTNGGDTWTVLPTDSTAWLRWVAFGPTYPRDGAIWRQFLDAPGGIEVTKDRGATWRPLASAPASPALTLAGPPTPDPAPWAATAYGVVSWPDSSSDATFLHRFAHGRGSTRINLALSPAFETDGTAIAESVITRDRGVTWQPLPFAQDVERAAGAFGSSQVAAFSPNYASDGVALVAFDDWPSNPVTDLRRTPDHGATWASGTLPVGSVSAIVFDADNARRVYAGGEGGVAISTDAGATWQNAGEPLSLLHVRGLAARQENGVGVVYAATTSAGVWRSADGGATWTRLNAGLSDGYLCALAGNADLLATATCAGQVYLLAPDGVWERAGGPRSGGVNHMMVQGQHAAGRIFVASNTGVWSAAIPFGSAKQTWLPLIRR
jgi:hypothetical protein